MIFEKLMPNKLIAMFTAQKHALCSCLFETFIERGTKGSNGDKDSSNKRSRFISFKIIYQNYRLICINEPF